MGSGMTTKVLRGPEDIPKLANFISARTKYPITVSITQGAPRTDAQNRLAQKWNADISRQLGDMTFEEVRAFNKLTIGIPILREADEAFREQYDKILKHLGYEEKLEAIRIFDMPVTRLMKTPQMTEFMDQVQRFWSGKGIVLTDPDTLGMEEMLR